MLLLYNAIIMSLVAVRMGREYKIVSYAVVVMLLISNLRFFLFFHTSNKTGEALSMIMTISNNTTSDELVLNMNAFPFGVFNKDPHYYWFSWANIGNVDAKKYHYAPEFDINKILVEQRPRFVYYEDYLHPGYSNGDQRYDMDMQLLLKYYEPAGTNVLFVRKMKMSKPPSIDEIQEKSTSKLFKVKPEVNFIPLSF
jgi:hypothetical protein